MITRCENPKATKYPDYGGRGIRVCEQWRQSFQAFLADVGLRPSSQHSLDRFPDNDGHYEPGNGRWATRVEQMNNQRTNHSLEWNGEQHTVSQWARLRGIRPRMLNDRLRLGWSVERALTTPAG